MRFKEFMAHATHMDLQLLRFVSKDVILAVADPDLRLRVGGPVFLSV